MPPCQQSCFWEADWMAWDCVVCTDALDSHSGWEQEKRNDWDQASSWGGILAWIWHHGAELIDRQLWEIFTYIHAPRLGTKREGGVNTLSRCRPVVVPGYQRVRQLRCPLTYGKMESGAEASPQHLPRRKAVLHSLEDQKRVSYQLILLGRDQPSCPLDTVFMGNLLKLNCCCLISKPWLELLLLYLKAGRKSHLRHFFFAWPSSLKPTSAPLCFSLCMQANLTARVGLDVRARAN